MDYEDDEIRKEMFHLYWKKGMTIRQVAEKTGIPPASLHELFKKFGLRTRNIKEAHKLRRKLKKERRDEKGRFISEDL